MKPLHATLLQMYKQCPAKFDFMFNKALPNIESSALRKGRAFHAFAETYINHLISKHRTSDREWVKSNSGNTFAPLAALDDEEYADVLGIIESYFGDNFIFEPPSWEHVQAEQKFAFNEQWEVCEVDSEQSIFNGTIDLLMYDHERKRIRIIDYKTDRGLPKQEIVYRSLQVLAYSFAGFMFYPEATECEFILQYVRFPRAGGRSRIVDRGEAMMWPTIEAEYREKIVAGDFAPRPNQWCFHEEGFCPFLRICPAYKNLNGDVGHALRIPESADDAEKMASEMYRLDAALKAVRANLRHWVREHGPIHLGDNEYIGYTESSKKKRSAFAVAEYLKSYQIHADEIMQLFNPDSRRLEKFLKENDIPAMDFQEEISSEFGEYKV